MSIKKILLPLPGWVDHTGEVNIGVSAAKTLRAHVEALFISERPPLSRWKRVRDEHQGGSLVRVDALTDEQKRRAQNAQAWFAEEQQNLASKAQELFVGACKARGIPLIAESEKPATLPAGSWRQIQAEEFFESVVAQRAAAFDLVVAADPAVLVWLRGISGELLATRRPVLLAPMSSEEELDLTGPAIVAWDESLECWHALSAALPLLKLARSVEVIRVEQNEDSRPAPNARATQAEALTYLHCHGISATARVIGRHLTVARTLLAEAAKQHAGLLVMGAYSHSPWREMLTGGATHDILKHAVVRPVLMAH